MKATIIRLKPTYGSKSPFDLFHTLVHNNYNFKYSSDTKIFTIVLSTEQEWNSFSTKMGALSYTLDEIYEAYHGETI
jgi:hypothetical protein